MKKIDSTYYSHFQLSAKARRALRRVARLILAEPRRFNMNHWERRVTRGNYIHPLMTEFLKSQRLKMMPPCGTTACLAGWLDLNDRTRNGKLPRIKTKQETVVPRAERILGFDKHPDRSDISHHLFFAHSWPFGEYKIEPENTQDLRKNARLGADYIEYILEHGIPYITDTE